MSLYITSLNSGSNGNCYYIGNDNEAVLVDAGLSCRETEKRMRRLGLSFEKVKAIFVSHEHDDHIKGITNIVKKYPLPVYITEDTLTNGRLILETHLVKSFRAYEPITIGQLTITAFPKFHDAADPHSFIISSSGAETAAAGASGGSADATADTSVASVDAAAHQINIGVFTDIGAPCEHLIHHFKKCHAAFLEANYDEGMLESGSYPYHLKQRIRGGNGHLSNRQALELFLAHRPPFMTHLFLAHLSQNNNDPDAAHNLFHAHAGDTKIILASRYEETPLYTIEGCEVGDELNQLRPIAVSVALPAVAAAAPMPASTTTSPQRRAPRSGKKTPPVNPLQTSLF